MPVLDMITRLERALIDSQLMLAAAREGRWDDLIALEATRQKVMQSTNQVDTRVPEGALVVRKKELIRDILATDAQIKELTKVWMGELESVLTSVQVERKLIRAYESR